MSQGCYYGLASAIMSAWGNDRLNKHVSKYIHIHTCVSIYIHMYMHVFMEWLPALYTMAYMQFHLRWAFGSTGVRSAVRSLCQERLLEIIHSGALSGCHGDCSGCSPHGPSIQRHSIFPKPLLLVPKDRVYSQSHYY